MDQGNNQENKLLCSQYPKCTPLAPEDCIERRQCTRILQGKLLYTQHQSADISEDKNKGVESEASNKTIMARVTEWEVGSSLDKISSIQIYTEQIQESNIPQSKGLGKIFVGGLSPATSENTLKDYFQVYGEILEVMIMRDKDTNTQRGFGFVTFRDLKVFEDVVQMTPHVIDGKLVECKRAIPKETAGSNQKIQGNKLLHNTQKRTQSQNTVSHTSTNLNSPNNNYRSDIQSQQNQMQYQHQERRANKYQIDAGEGIGKQYQQNNVSTKTSSFDGPTISYLKAPSNSNSQGSQGCDNNLVEDNKQLVKSLFYTQKMALTKDCQDKHGTSNQEIDQASRKKEVPKQETKAEVFNQLQKQNQAIKGGNGVSRQKNFSFELQNSKEGFVDIIQHEQIENQLYNKISSMSISTQNEMTSEENADISTQFRKIFVGGLPHNLNDDEFKLFFLKFGEIEDSAILRDKRTGKPRGFGFVTYKEIETVEYVMEIKDQHIIQGKWVDCKRAVPAEDIVKNSPNNDKKDTVSTKSTPQVSSINQQCSIPSGISTQAMNQQQIHIERIDNSPSLYQSYQQQDLQKASHQPQGIVSYGQQANFYYQKHPSQLQGNLHPLKQPQHLYQSSTGGQIEKAMIQNSGLNKSGPGIFPSNNTIHHQNQTVPNQYINHYQINQLQQQHTQFEQQNYKKFTPESQPFFRNHQNQHQQNIPFQQAPPLGTATSGQYLYSQQPHPQYQNYQTHQQPQQQQQQQLYGAGGAGGASLNINQTNFYNQSLTNNYIQQSSMPQQFQMMAPQCFPPANTYSPSFNELGGPQSYLQNGMYQQPSQPFQSSVGTSNTGFSSMNTVNQATNQRINPATMQSRGQAPQNQYTQQPNFNENQRSTASQNQVGNGTFQSGYPHTETFKKQQNELQHQQQQHIIQLTYAAKSAGIPLDQLLEQLQKTYQQTNTPPQQTIPQSSLREEEDSPQIQHEPKFKDQKQEGEMKNIKNSSFSIEQLIPSNIMAAIQSSDDNFFIQREQDPNQSMLNSKDKLQQEQTEMHIYHLNAVYSKFSLEDTDKTGSAGGFNSQFSGSISLPQQFLNSTQSNQIQQNHLRQSLRTSQQAQQDNNSTEQAKAIPNQKVVSNKESTIHTINEEIKELECSNYDHESQDYKKRENVQWHDKYEKNSAAKNQGTPSQSSNNYQQSPSPNQNPLSGFYNHYMNQGADNLLVVGQFETSLSSKSADIAKHVPVQRKDENVIGNKQNQDGLLNQQKNQKNDIGLTIPQQTKSTFNSRQQQIIQERRGVLDQEVNSRRNHEMSPDDEENKFNEGAGTGDESDPDYDNNSIKDELAMFAEQEDPDKEINSCPLMQLKLIKLTKCPPRMKRVESEGKLASESDQDVQRGKQNITGGGKNFGSINGGGRSFLNLPKNKNGIPKDFVESPVDSKPNSYQCSTGSDKQNGPINKPKVLENFY